MATDIEIAQKATLQRITKVAKDQLGIDVEHLSPTAISRPRYRSTM